MRILHYSLGFPPYRTGGLTKYCMDLMKQQIKEGHKVSLMWPGEIKIFEREVKIRKHDSIEEIGNYEIINPLPVSLDEGIKDFDAYKASVDSDIFAAFIKNRKPDVIHFHTLMGLHKSFIDKAKKDEIRLVFTAHDFFPICPKVTMFRHGQICNCIESCEECGICNNTALSLRRIQILQSPFYRALKDNIVIKKLRKHHRDGYLGDDYERDVNGSVGDSDDYKRLRNYYYEMMSLMDVIHYNSTVTKNAYEKVFDLPKNKVLNITHGDIADHKKNKSYSDSYLRIRFLGPQSGSKGFFVLKEALDELWKEKQNFCLDVHFNPVNPSPYMKVHDRYNYGELEEIFDKTDVLVAPSIWYETFGYTVLEALSYGVPVIISDTVGAKDILADGAGVIISKIDSQKLLSLFRSLTIERLRKMNDRIIREQKILTIETMCKDTIDKLYN